MIPGHKYTPQDVLDAVNRRKWLLICPVLVFAIAAFLITRSMPNLYRSETTILVVPQRVPESYIRSTVTNRIEDRLRSIREQVLSRSMLEPVILEFDLYPEQRKQVPMEDVVARMRTEVDVDPPVRDDTFKISYVSGDPVVAMKVVSRLASMFIDGNVRDRRVVAEGTNQFLESQLEDARLRLIDREKKLEEYRRRYLGELPSQLQSNLQVIQTTQIQLQSLSESLNRDRDRRLVLERALADMRADPATAAATADPSDRPADPLDAARTELATLERKFRATHPDVIAAKRRVAQLEAERVAMPKAPDALASAAAPQVADNVVVRRMRETQTEIEKLDRQIAGKEADGLRLRGTIAEYQRRVEAAPTRESEMAELTRDYETLKKGYESLLAKKEDSNIAANLEKQQVGEQFKVLDPARVPERPFSPKRFQLNAMAVGIGLMLGIAVAALLEYRDTSLRTESQLLQAFKIPVLAVLPVMESIGEKRRRMLRLAFTFTGGFLLIASAAVGAAWRLGLLKRVF
jgi:polysaccharide chain length determinant protein (PEP-CTERM system associated)